MKTEAAGREWVRQRVWICDLVYSNDSDEFSCQFQCHGRRDIALYRLLIRSLTRVLLENAMYARRSLIQPAARGRWTMSQGKYPKPCLGIRKLSWDECESLVGCHHILR